MLRDDGSTGIVGTVVDGCVGGIWLGVVVYGSAIGAMVLLWLGSSRGGRLSILSAMVIVMTGSIGRSVCSALGVRDDLILILVIKLLHLFIALCKEWLHRGWSLRNVALMVVVGHCSTSDAIVVVSD